MPSPDPAIPDPSTLALQALGWILTDEPRAQRFLSLTGLTPDSLRGALDDPATQAAVLDFLAAHEPDLIAAAGTLGVDPAEFSAARKELRA
jgi:hypothetical protein